MKNTIKKILRSFLPFCMVFAFTASSLTGCNKPVDPDDIPPGEMVQENKTPKKPAPEPEQEEKTEEKTEDTQKTEEKSYDELTPEEKWPGIELTTEDIGVPVLYYHSVEDVADNDAKVTPGKLKTDMEYIKANYTAVTLKDLYKHLAENAPIPKNALVITFDDGYQNNYTAAMPILEELGLKATLFCIGKDLNGEYYLAPDGIKAMSDSVFDVESHTISHPHMPEMSYDGQLKEFTDSKSLLEGITGKTLIATCYPFGEYNDDTIKSAQDAGFKMSFTMKPGLADRGDNIMALDRIYVGEATNLADAISATPK